MSDLRIRILGKGPITLHILERFSKNHDISIYSEVSEVGESDKILQYDKLLEEKIVSNDVFIIAWRELPEEDSIKSAVLNYLSNNVNESNILFYLSSVAVYGQSNAPNKESSPLVPINKYGSKKVDFEKYLLDRVDAEVCILRVSNVFGCVEFDDVINRIITACLKKIPLKLIEPGSVSRDFIFIESISDVINQLIISAKRKSIQRIFNLGSGHSTYLVDILNLIEMTLDVKLEFETLPLDKEVITTSRISTLELTRMTSIKSSDQMSHLVDYIYSMKLLLDSQENPINTIKYSL